MQQFFEYSPDVEQSIKQKKPVLALESSLLTHGLPYPNNLEIAKAMAQIAKEHDVTPAFIAIIKGKIKIGLTDAEIEMLVQDKQALKASTSDIPYLLNQGLNAGTTVAATAFCADSAGIKIFATGGIGGVHRGDSSDISADLIELARTPIAVIASGGKAILDLPKTLEFLETFSIPIIGYRTNYFPAFYSAESNCRLPMRIDNVPALVKVLKTHWQLGLPSSILIANPIDKEDEVPNEMIETAIIESLRIAEDKKITGKEITPFLLTEISHVTGGLSLLANIKLLKNNAKLVAMLAHALTHI